MKIKEKVLMERKRFIEENLEEYSKKRGEKFFFNYATVQDFGLMLLENNLAEVGKVIDEWAIKRGLKQDNMPNIAYEELKKQLGI